MTTLDYWCWYCGAEPDTPCRRKNGKVCESHEPRYRQLEDAMKGKPAGETRTVEFIGGKMTLTLEANMFEATDEDAALIISIKNAWRKFEIAHAQ